MKISLDELLNVKKAFITSITTLVFPIVRVNNQPIRKSKPGEMAIRLREIYLQKAN
ncbi:hypothetical protein [Providencia sp. Me31A]|uniref:hypothetical protein n=1 Tax=Providencia sp. Me31A TaxID=3392637 RepID=UPI003D299D0B